MSPKYLASCIGLILATGGLTGCGGGGSDTSSTGPTTTIGTITGFGSIYVNGVKFETDSASYEVDDEAGYDDSYLSVGMKVRVEGTVNADGLTGTATSVYYDDDVEGPIDGPVITDADGNKTFTIFGLPILADASSTVFDDGASFESLTAGQVLEISGFFDGTQIVATRIEKQSDTDDYYELKGTVVTYTGTEVTLTLQNGAMAGPFDISTTAIMEIPSDPTGLFVELYLDDSTGSMLVTKIEQDDEDLLYDSDNEVSIEGVVSDAVSGGLMINGIKFTTNDSTVYSPSSLEGTLAAGMELEVEGYMQDGVLIAREVESEDGDIEMTARVISVNAIDTKNGSVTLDMGNGQILVVYTNNSTQFEDDSSLDINNDDSFNLDELSIGTDYVKTEVYISDTNQLTATSIKRMEGTQDTRLEGPVDNIDLNNSITVLNITYNTVGSTRYEINDVTTDSASFYGTVQTGDVVEIKDVQPDGTAEELDLED